MNRLRGNPSKKSQTTAPLTGHKRIEFTDFIFISQHVAMVSRICLLIHQYCSHWNSSDNFLLDPARLRKVASLVKISVLLNNPWTF